MRAFAFLSLAAAALAAPTFAPGGSVAEVVAPVVAPVRAVAGVVANVDGYVNAAAANVEANYNQVGNNDVNGNNIHVARSIAVGKIGLNKVPIDVNAPQPQVNALSDVHQRAVAAAYAPIFAIVKALAALCAQVGVDVNAAVANIGINYNEFLNNSLNNNDISVLDKRAVVDVLTQAVAIIFACVKALINVGVPVTAVIGNVTATANQVANNVGNGNNVVVARGLVTAVAPVTAVITAIIPILARVCADVTAEILNVALNYNAIGNNLLNGNTIHLL